MARKKYKQSKNILIKHIGEFDGNGFTQPPNSITRNMLDDLYLSADARFLFIMILSLSEDFIPNQTWLMNQTELSEGRYRKAIKELKENKLLNITKLPNYDGNHGYIYLYEICNYPIDMLGIQFQGIEFKGLKNDLANQTIENTAYKNIKGRIKNKNKNDSIKKEEEGTHPTISQEVSPNEETQEDVLDDELLFG